MSWKIEYTNEFGSWFATLNEINQDKIVASVELLGEMGPKLPFPFSSGVNGSEYEHMRELRVQVQGSPIRIFYAFDPRRVAILLVGGVKSGNKRFYERMIPIADELYQLYLEELRDEGLI